MRIGLIVVGLLLSATAAHAGNPAPMPAEVRKAVERSLPFLEKEGLAWKNERNCLSCHHVPFLLWSHREAQARGIVVDTKKLADWTDWSIQQSLSARAFFKLTEKTEIEPDLKEKLKPLVNKGFTHEKEFRDALSKALTPEERKQHEEAIVKRAAAPKKGGQNDGGGLDTLGQLMLGWYDGDGKSKSFLPATADLLLRWQEPSGIWKAAGQLPARKWSGPVADQTTTMWLLLGLARVEEPEPRVRKAVEQARSVVIAAKADANHEWQVARLIIEHQFGKPALKADMRKQLIARQNPDGGWSWLPQGKSDALSTGLSLYALQRTGFPLDAQAIAQGQAFLLQSQQADGSWLVSPGDISSTTNPGRLKRLEPIYHYWGSAWASIGLSRTLAD